MRSESDFTTDLRLLWISAIAIPVGLMCAVVAKALQGLIGFFTNLFYFQQFGIPGESLTPASSTLGWLAIFVPALGGLIIGLMARYGSERIRGHGIPEAIEAILMGQSRMQPRVAVLKPFSSAISIGSGGPFGSEGPIIMTGGALGSLVAQAFHMTSAERKTLLVAGAAGGMSATFGTPVAAVLLAVELLLFEWKPRSLVPVGLTCAVAAATRSHVELGSVPLFDVPLHTVSPPSIAVLSAVFAGLAAGVLALLLTRAVYTAEDLFHRLPIHWMWWPMIGGLIVGIGGYFQPRALGVGYDVISDLLRGDFVPQALVGLIVVKCLIWSLALGSGTSGGVLAPLLIMGGALGALESTFLPGGDTRLWPLVGMAAVMGGTMRSPLTGVVFALELTYDIRALVPVLTASIVAHAFTVLLMKRSILTEKVARRGFHVSREYTVDPLERLRISDVMSSDVISLPATLSIKSLITNYFLDQGPHKHQGYPVVDPQGKLLGVVTKRNVLSHWVNSLLDGNDNGFQSAPIITFDLLERPAVSAFPWESCRTIAERMADSGVGRLPVVAPEDSLKVIGMVTRSDLLKARSLQTAEEGRRERFFNFKSSLAQDHTT